MTMQKVTVHLPGGKQEVEITDPAARCDKCDNCNMVNTTKHIILSDSSPAGLGLGTAHVEMWNQILVANPCTNPKLIPFELWTARVDNMFVTRVCCSWLDLCGEETLLHKAWVNGESPREFCDWYIEKYNLDELSDYP